MEMLSLKKSNAAFIIACVMLASASTAQAARRTRRVVKAAVLPANAELLQKVCKSGDLGKLSVKDLVKKGRSLVFDGTKKGFRSYEPFAYDVQRFVLFVGALTARVTDDALLQRDWAGNGRYYQGKFGFNNYAEFKAGMTVLAQLMSELSVSLQDTRNHKTSLIASIAIGFQARLNKSEAITDKLADYLSTKENRLVLGARFSKRLK